MVVVSSENTQSLRDFVLWAIDQLGWEWQRRNGVYRVHVPPKHHPMPAEEVEFCFDTDEGEQDEQVARLTTGGPLFRQLVEALSAQKEVAAAKPREQPESVHELTERLFSAYTIEVGRVDLAGCWLEDRPFLRLTYQDTGGAGEPDLNHFYFDGQGRIAKESEVAELGLDEIIPWEDDPPEMPEEEFQRLLEAGRSQAEKLCPDRAERIAAVLIWCKFVEGKLEFEIGNASARLPFADWARRLQPPPFGCPHSGKETFHLAATDDGRIVAAEALETCAQTGRKVSAGELVECSATGRRVLPEFVRVCPVTEQPVMRDELVECPVTRQPMSPAALAGGVCRPYRNLRPVSKDDPRMARILGEYPGLDHWRKWAIAEAGTFYLLVARQWMRRLLVVVDKETLEPLHLALGHRFSGSWRPLEPEQYEEYLRRGEE